MVSGRPILVALNWQPKTWKMKVISQIKMIKTQEVEDFENMGICEVWNVWCYFCCVWVFRFSVRHCSKSIRAILAVMHSQRKSSLLSFEWSHWTCSILLFLTSSNCLSFARYWMATLFWSFPSTEEKTHEEKGKKKSNHWSRTNEQQEQLKNRLPLL